MQLAVLTMLLSLGASVSANDSQASEDYYVLDDTSGYSSDSYEETMTYDADAANYGYFQLLLGTAVTFWLLGCACGCCLKKAPEPRTIYMGYYHQKPCMLASNFSKKPTSLHFYNDCYSLRNEPVVYIDICKLCAKKER